MGPEETPMKTLILTLSFTALAFGFEAVEEKETIRKTFAGAKEIEIDNVNGSIHAVGYSGAEIQVEILKTLRADDASRAEAAKREVKLDITETGGTAKIYVDGPFRCHCEEGHNWRSRNNMNEHGRRGYRVDFDYELKVPAGVKLYLATINHGQIKVERVTGDYDIENINGGIEMSEVSGSGHAYALNGKMSVVFAKNPERASDFGSLNGAVEISFRPNLSADLRFKTFNGHVYTDFPVSSLPPLAPVSEHKNGKFVYRSSDFTGVRVGNGGPEYKFDAFNGNIRIINRGQ
jgi:hypothetical protein